MSAICLTFIGPGVPSGKHSKSARPYLNSCSLSSTMLSALKILDSKLQRCVAEGHKQGGLACGADQSRPLVGPGKNMLRGKVFYFARKDDEEKRKMEKSEISQIPKDELRQKLMEGKILMYFEQNDICDISQQSLADPDAKPIVYIGTQDSMYLRVYDERFLLQYYDMLIRERRPIIEPASRQEVTSARIPYNRANLIPAYMDGRLDVPPAEDAARFLRYDPAPSATPLPIPALPAPVGQPLPLTPQPRARQGVINDLVVTTGRALNGQRIVYANGDFFVGNNSPDRFSMNIASRVKYGIFRFFRGSARHSAMVEQDVEHLEEYQLINVFTDVFYSSVNMPALCALMRFTRDSGSYVNNGLMSAEPRREVGGGIVFMEDPPERHRFRGERGHMLESLYIDFFLCIFQAYFYTDMTGRLIRVTRNFNVYNFYIPVTATEGTWDSETIIIE